ncbi:unnamed protein product [Withania somnifera]
MAEEFQLGRGNWWESSTSASSTTTSSSRNKFIDSGNSSCTTPSVSSTTVLSSMGSNFVNWPTSDNNSMVFVGADSHKRYASESSVGGGDGGAGQGVLSVDPNLQMMGLGLPSQGLDWNQPFFEFRSLLQEGLSSNANYQQEGTCHEQDNNNWKPNNFSNAGRSLYYNPTYNNPSNCDVNNIPPTSADVMSSSSSSSSWSKFPQFLPTLDPPKYKSGRRSSPSLHHGRSSHFHTGEVRNMSTTTKKNSSETSNKRPRNETPSPLPAFKVRKEKMGDRITALQQLVSPFGKTDTASVLSEAIEYIKFLHEQVNVLSTPYMKSGASMQNQQSTTDKSNVNEEGGKQDLRSRGLCLVPVSSTFPVTHETTVDFWTPTFGGTFR